MKNKIKLRRQLVGTSPTILQDVPQIAYLNKKVRFSLRDCDTKDFDIRGLSDKEILSLYKRLGYFEQMTWRDVNQRARESGFSIEKKGDSNQALLSTRFPHFSTFLHFRVGGTESIFRVFGALSEDLCYILLADYKGSINH